MRRTMTALLAIGALAVPALAQDPVSISPIGFGPELTEKADEYGQRELDYLANEMREDLERELSGMLGENGLRLEVTILDATPNRPTMEQMAARGLHHAHQAGVIHRDVKPHNLLIAEAERVVVTVDRHANTSAASVPLALDVAVKDGRIKRGDLLLLEAMGGGFTWGASLLRW